MFGLLSRKESKSILKTASDDADTLSLAHEKNASFGLSDGESVTTSKLDDREFEFDFEIINTAAYRKVFNKARSPKKDSQASFPSHAPASSGAGASESVRVPPINAFAGIHPVAASQESEPFSSRPDASSREIRSHSVLPKDSTEGAGDGTGGMREEQHNVVLKDQPESTSKMGEYRIREYSIGTTIGTGRKGKVKLAWKKDHNDQFAIKFIRRESGVSDTNLLRKTLDGFAILSGLSHPNIIRLHEILEIDSHSAVVLDYISGGNLAEYVTVQTRVSEHIAQRIFAQIISAVWYLHRKRIVHSRLSPSKVFLDSNENVILSGFSNAKTFNTPYMARFNQGQFMWGTSEYPNSYASGSSPGNFYEESSADVWSCGTILVSAQYGLILDTNDLKYFMLAGYLPFPGGVPLYYTLGTSVVTFPESFPVRAQDLVRRMFGEPWIWKPQAHLKEVAGQTWLKDYTHVVSDVIGNLIS